jgi:hypothetical protein
MQDHRQTIRWRANWQAKIKLEQAENFTNCLIHDITIRGLRVCLPEKMGVDTSIKLNLSLSDDCSLENLEAWVVWRKTVDGNHFHGLYFTKISDPCKEKLYQFMRSNFCDQMNKHWWKDVDKDINQKKGDGDMDDRRIFERFEKHLELSFLNLYSGTEGQGQTRDLSAKGIRLVADQKLEPQTPLEMWLKIPDKGEPLYLRGEVVWSELQEADKYHCGVNLEKADLMGISRVLRS